MYSLPSVYTNPSGNSSGSANRLGGKAYGISALHFFNSER